MTDIFAAIADPVRRQILDALAEQPGLSVNELVTITKLGQPAVSKHLKTLRDAGAVSVKTVGSSRHYYAEPSALTPIELWLVNQLAHQAGQVVEEKMDDLGEKVGTWLAQSASWLTEQAAEKGVSFDAREVGRKLGRKLAEAKVETDKAVQKQTGKDIEGLVGEVKRRATSAKKKVDDLLK
jgi:DNA-binding transcriptional ArsR family regulator